MGTFWLNAAGTERRVGAGRVSWAAVVWAVFACGAVGAGERASEDARPFTVRLQIDKPYCVLHFLETLRTRGYYGPTLYEHYKKSKYSDDEALAKLVQQYSRVKIAYGYHFDGYPKYRYMTKDRATSDIFFALSARTASLEEFQQMTVGIIPFDDHRRLFEILKAVEPIYDALVWDPYYAKAQVRLKGLKEYAETAHLGARLPPIAHLVNSSWSPEIPVIVSFSIVPGEKIKLVPPPVGNVIRAGLLTESEDYSWYIGLITHEFAHRAFAEQPRKTHQQIDQWLTESQSPHRGIVNLMFNEVLGGAIGHKVRADLLGQAQEFTYNQPVIKAFDEAIYPLVVSYLEEGKSIDGVFVNECLALYAKTFPDALREYRSLFQAYYLLTDVEGGREQKLPQAIRQNLVPPMMYEVASGITDDNIEALRAYDFTKVVVITKDHERAIGHLRRKISALGGFAGLDAGAEWVLSCHDAAGSPYVIVNIRSVDAFEEVTKRLKTAKMIDPENAILHLGP